MATHKTHNSRDWNIPETSSQFLREYASSCAPASFPTAKQAMRDMTTGGDLHRKQKGEKGIELTRCTKALGHSSHLWLRSFLWIFYTNGSATAQQRSSNDRESAIRELTMWRLRCDFCPKLNKNQQAPHLASKAKSKRTTKNDVPLAAARPITRIGFESKM